MEKSNYITENQALIEAVKRACATYGIEYTGFSQDWIIRLRRTGSTRFIFGYGFDWNTQAGRGIASDKVATYQLLVDARIGAVPHYLLKSLIDSEVNIALLRTLIDFAGSVVVKPLHEGRGRAVRRFETIGEVQAFTERIDIESWTVAPFIDIKRELRVIVFKSSILLAYEKIQPTFINNLKMFNLNLGAQARSIEVEEIDEKLQELAIKAMDAIGLNLGAVDIVFDYQGDARVIEINSAFSLEHYANLHPTNREKVINMYEYIIKSMFF